MKLTPYICKCCGGPINVSKMRCDYCGTAYEDPSLKRIKIEMVRPGEHTITTQIEVDDEVMQYNPEGARDYVLKALREQLADSLKIVIWELKSFEERYA